MLQEKERKGSLFAYFQQAKFRLLFLIYITPYILSGLFVTCN